MSCDDFLTVQVGQEFLDWTNLTIRNGAGANGKSASFNFTLRSGQSLPPKGSLVSIVLNGTKKMFGGIAGNIKKVKLFPKEYSCTCVDFTIFTRKLTIISYDSVQAAAAGSHAANLTRLGIIAQDVDQTKVTRQLLSFVPPIEPDENQFRFKSQNEKLDAALTRLCGQAGYKWSVDNGSWLRVDQLDNVTSIANITLTPNNATAKYSTVSIDLDDADCGKWENLSTDFQARDITRVIVAKDAESLAIGQGITPTENTHAQSIAVGSMERFFRLFKRTGIVKKAIIIANDPPGGGGGGGGA